MQLIVYHTSYYIFQDRTGTSVWRWSFTQPIQLNWRRILPDTSYVYRYAET